jgi:hypothetical protein
LLVVGSEAETEFASSLLTQRGAAAHLIIVEPATTRACVAALRRLDPRKGVLVTHREHVPRVRLSWFLEGFSPTPMVVSASEAEVSGEYLKTLWYLLRY